MNKKSKCSLCYVLPFTEIRKQNMLKMLVSTLHVKVNAKLTNSRLCRLADAPFRLVLGMAAVFWCAHDGDVSLLCLAG